MMKKRLLKFSLLVSLLLTFSACQESQIADLVVYGNIYTSDEAESSAQAFAVKDGKYIFVGDSLTASKYVKDGVTEVIHHANGMVMAGCTEGHGHYITEAMFKQLCYLKGKTFDECLAEIKAYREQHPELKQLFGYGWFEANFDEEKDLPRFREELDKIVPDIPVFICDLEMHQGWVNSVTLNKVGILNGPKVAQDVESVKGGTIYRNPATGIATGRVQDQACGYVRLKAFGPLLGDAECEKAGQICQETLLADGYTNYLDAWLSYDNSDDAYRALSSLDQKGELHMNVVGCYEIDSYKIQNKADYEKEVQTAKSWKDKYTTTHFLPTSVKLFADGCTESFKGYVKHPYPATGTTGSRNWNPDMLNAIVAYINQQGLLVHTHAYGDAAVEEIVNAYVNSAKQFKDKSQWPRNSVGHAASVDDSEMKLIKEYGISVAENFCWHSTDTYPGMSVEDGIQHSYEIYGKDFYLNMYPMKRFFDFQIPVSSSTDAPCSSGFPRDPFGIMEMEITAVNPQDPAVPRYAESCLNIKQAIRTMTINGAWQLGIEKERGSIEVGKYADFILIDTDLLKCKITDLHKTKVEKTFFEGKEVYSLK